MMAAHQWPFFILGGFGPFQTEAEGRDPSPTPRYSFVTNGKGPLSPSSPGGTRATWSQPLFRVVAPSQAERQFEGSAKVLFPQTGWVLGAAAELLHI